MPNQGITSTQFRSDGIQEIISRRSGFVEKWSLWIYLTILIFFIFGTWFIQYPDIINTSAVLTAENAPKEIVTQQEGKIVRMFFQNESDVEKGQMIAWIESISDHNQIIALSKILDSNLFFLNSGKSENVPGLFHLDFNSLGGLQPAYQLFLASLQQFSDYLSSGYFFKRKKLLYDDEENLKKMHSSIEQQIALAKKDLEITQEAMEANSALFKQKVISLQDIRDMKSRLYVKEMSMPQLASALFTNEISQADKKKEIEELEHAISQQKMIYQQASQTFKSLIDEWKRKFVVSAPVSGKISFIIPLQENQYVQNGKIIGYVNPPDSKYFAFVTLAQGNFGKVKKGQKVQLRFDAYPYQEYGYVSGRLIYLSKVPSDSGFLANIELPEGLKTNYNIDLQYRNGLRSQAMIITNNTRLIKRFYYNILKGISR